VEGVRLLLHQSGSGGPAVVFLAGGGAVGLDYLNVQQRAGELTTSMTYDRAGTGWSDSVDLPRASVEITDELRALLRVAEVPAPYVMVEVRHAGRMPDVPVIILTSMGIDSFKAAVSQGIPESLLREEIEGKRRLYTMWAHALHGDSTDRRRRTRDPPLPASRRRAAGNPGPTRQTRRAMGVNGISAPARRPLASTVDP
jgi:hypothetical protein